jgi:hypothetical protein
MPLGLLIVFLLPMAFVCCVSAPAQGAGAPAVGEERGGSAHENVGPRGRAKAARVQWVGTFALDGPPRQH